MPETKQCRNCQKEFIIEDEDFEFYEKMKVPAPTWCPDCRVWRRMGFYNQTKLYKRKCDATGKMIFSIISEDYPGKVYDAKYWWSDNWDAVEYARDYDFSKPFFRQIKELFLEVPRFSRSVVNLVNSDYCAGASDLKDCYLVFNSGFSEGCLYSVKLSNAKDSVDCYNVVKSELCSNDFMVKNSYKVHYSQHCDNCRDVYFSRNLKNCNNCLACVNLRNKSYCIFNKQYSEKEYWEKIEEFNLGSYTTKKEFDKQLKNFFLKYPVKYLIGIKNQNVSGNYINVSKNVKKSDHVAEAEDCKYCYSYAENVKDSHDCTLFGDGAELMYESAVCGLGVANLKFCNHCYTSDNNLEYCAECMSCSDCFACVGLRKKQYHILNKPYPKEEYFKMVEKIKKHMNEMPYTDKQGNEYKYGEFFPPELSPFAYNETIVQEYFPLTKEEAKEQGYKWKNPEKKDYQTTIEAKDLPDNIKDVDDSILKEVVGCKTKSEDREKTGCTTAFKIIPKELEFYKKMNIPLPRYCPNCRHHERLKNRNPLKLYKRTCMKEGCDIEFETTYAPERKEIVYCEKCYNEEVG
jgi:hypothetical protein